MSTKTIKVLLVEDNVAEANLVQVQLTFANASIFSIQHAERVSDALELIAIDSFDVVLLDFNLPDCVGLEGLERIRAVVPDVPVVILINFTNEPTATQAVRDGAQDFLFKRDVDTQSLVRSIRYAMERQKADTALRISEERYTRALAGANDGIWDWEIGSHLAHFSTRWKAMLSYEDADLGNEVQEWFSMVHTDDRESFRQELEAHLQGATPFFEHEHRMRCKGGNYIWVLCRGLAVRDAEGRANRMAGSMSDITRRKDVEAQLMHEALHDPLTGLPNRTLFFDRVEQALCAVAREQSCLFSVLYFDLNCFKDINDCLGHSTGDALLKAIAKRLVNFIRPNDTLARLGGDEFAVLVFDRPDMNAVTHVADRIHELLAEKFIVNGNELFTSASMGIASASNKYKKPEELLRDADLAMYRAKHAGNKAYEIFDSYMHRSAVEKLRMEKDLRRALDKNEFVVYYQPIVSTQTGEITAFEALLRWNHPTRGLLYPGSFIQATEDSGMVVPIDWWVINEACRKIGELQKMSVNGKKVSVSVNISGKIFNDSEMASRLMGVLEDTKFNPYYLHLEITERSIMDHQRKAITELNKLRAAGVGLHIDDFGTGYSSLSYLQKFSYDTLKIDRSFVSKMSSCTDSEAIVKSIVALGKMLDINVVAEGVETHEQLTWLKEMGCPEVQGFLFSPAVDDVRASELLNSNWDTSTAH